MRTIAIVNQKGGTGKTTTAVNLSAALGERGKKVLLMDLDSQASATSWYGIKDFGKGIWEMFIEKKSLTDIVCPTGVKGVDVAPSSSWLVGLDKVLASEVGAETILRMEIQKLPFDRWDYVIADCPPALGILTVNALTAVKEVLVPVEAHVMALSGLAQLLKTVDVVKARLNPDLKITGILVCRMDSRTRHAQEIKDQLKARFSSLCYNTVIRENVRIAESPSFGKPIILYDSRSFGAKDYRSLAKEVIAQEENMD